MMMIIIIPRIKMCNDFFTFFLEKKQKTAYKCNRQKKNNKIQFCSVCYGFFLPFFFVVDTGA